MGRAILGLVIGLASGIWIFGPDEAPEAAFDRGHETGYNDGQWEVCNEIGDISLNVKNHLSNCDGF